MDSEILKVYIYDAASAAELTGHAPSSLRKYAVLHNRGRRIGRDWRFSDEDIAYFREMRERGTRRRS
jgi:hypothetical protein